MYRVKNTFFVPSPRPKEKSPWIGLGRRPREEDVALSEVARKTKPAPEENARRKPAGKKTTACAKRKSPLPDKVANGLSSRGHCQWQRYGHFMWQVTRYPLSKPKWFHRWTRRSVTLRPSTKPRWPLSGSKRRRLWLSSAILGFSAAYSRKLLYEINMASKYLCWKSTESVY